MLIGIMITIVVGVYLIPIITDSVKTAQDTAQASGQAGVSGLSSVLSYVLVAVILVGAVAWPGGHGGEGGRREVTARMETNSKSLIARLGRASDRLGEYINNLDTILSIKTVNDLNGRGYGLSLTDGKLNICGGDSIWDWYLVDKHPELPMFKIVGLHKTDASKNLVYVLGKGEEPYLIKVPNEHIEGKAELAELVKEKI